MGLSPEEKRKIYDEEKARLEAQDAIKQQKLQEETKKKAESTRKLGIGCLVAVAVLIVGGIAIGTCDEGADPKYTASPELQQQRLTWINECIAEGIFYKVEVPASLPHLWVTPTFMLLSFKDKETSVNVVWAYYICQNPKYHTVILYHSISGDKIGAYSETYGGLQLD